MTVPCKYILSDIPEAHLFALLVLHTLNLFVLDFFVKLGYAFPNRFRILVVPFAFLECGLCLIDFTGAEEETAKEELCLTVIGIIFHALFEERER